MLAADQHGDAVILSCSDADIAIRALLGALPGFRDIEVQIGSVEEAFVELTASQGDNGGQSTEAAR